MRKIIIFLILCLWSNVYGAYDETVLKDMGTNTPLGTENPNILDDKLRQLSRLLEIQYHERLMTVSGTATAADTYIIGSSSTSILCTLPSAASVANGTTTKIFVVKNRGAGTMTLSPTVDGVGSPTVSQNRAMTLFTDGTSWFEILPQNAGNATTFDGLSSSTFARSGANSDITAITGLTTYLAVGQGGSGANTAAGAASNLGFGTEDTPTVTGVVATGSSTLTTVTLTTGTVSGNLGITGSVSGLEDADIPNNATLDNLTQVTTRNYNDLTGTSTISPTTATITTALITNGTVSGTLQITGAITGLEDGDIPNDVTLTNLTQITTRNYADLSGTSSISPTTVTATTGNVTNISGTAGTWTGNIDAASASGFDYLKQWKAEGITGTGTLNIAAGLGVTLSPTYSNGNGTVTITASGTASAGGWTHTGTQTVGIAGSQVLPHGTFTLDAAYGMTGLTDAWIPDDHTLASFTNITTRNYADITGTTTITPTQMAIGTTTYRGALNVVGSVTVSGTLTATTFVGSITTSIADLVGSATASAEFATWLGNTYLKIPGTTTVFSTMGSSTTLYNLVRTKLTDYTNDGNTVLLLKCNNVGTTTFTDSSNNGYAVTANGNAIGSSTVIYEAGSGWLDGTGDFLTVADNSGMPNGTASFSLEKRFRMGTTTTEANEIYFFSQYLDASNFWRLYWFNNNNRIYFENYIAGVGNGFYATHTFTAETTYSICLDRNGITVDDWKIFVNGDSKALTLSEGGYGFSIYAATVDLAIGGRTDSTREITGLIDGVIVSKVSRRQSNYSTAISSYNYNTLQIIPPGTTTSAVDIQDDGTQSTSVVTFIRDRLVVGSSTETGTGTAYKGYFDGAVRATAFNVASTEEIKKNIKPIKIKPDLLDAEAEAKGKYIADNKPAWIANNKVNYAYVGSNTVTYINKQAMEKDYKDYIELLWVSDPNQGTLTTNIQKKYEKKFWQEFDSMRPRSWNPKENLKLERKGFVVEEAPPGIIGDDGASIDPMAVIVFMKNAISDCKKEIEELKKIINP